MNNRELKIAMYRKNIKHKQAAAMLGLHTRTFTNKLNGIVVNGYKAHFTMSEKKCLAAEFNLSVEEIE